jgi:hypothetical protein
MKEGEEREEIKGNLKEKKERMGPPGGVGDRERFGEHRPLCINLISNGIISLVRLFLKYSKIKVTILILIWKRAKKYKIKTRPAVLQVY